MYVQKVAQQGGGTHFRKFVYVWPTLLWPSQKKRGGHFYTTLKFSREYLKYGFVFLRKKKNRFFLCLKIHKNSKKINLK